MKRHVLPYCVAYHCGRRSDRSVHSIIKSVVGASECAASMLAEKDRKYLSASTGSATFGAAMLLQ